MRAPARRQSRAYAHMTLLQTGRPYAPIPLHSERRRAANHWEGAPRTAGGPHVVRTARVQFGGRCPPSRSAVPCTPSNRGPSSDPWQSGGTEYSPASSKTRMRACAGPRLHAREGSRLSGGRSDSLNRLRNNVDISESSPTDCNSSTKASDLDSRRPKFKPKLVAFPPPRNPFTWSLESPTLS